MTDSEAQVDGATPRPRVLLISPVRNEAEHIEAVAAAVSAQTVPPSRWLVVDDDSTDGTLEKLHRLESTIPFMEVLEVPPGLTLGAKDRLASAAVERAYNFALASLDWRRFEFIGKLDGDTLIPPNYVEQIVNRFQRQPGLGIASGAFAERSGGTWKEVPTPADHATGLCRVYRRECLEAVGGIAPQLGSDAIAVMRARISGFETRTFRDLLVRHLRPMGSVQGQLRGRLRHGRTHYIVGYGLGWALLRSVRLAVKARPLGIGGVAFLLGYVQAAITRERRVDDPEFMAFVRAEQRARMERVVRQVLPGRSRDRGAAGET